MKEVDWFCGVTRRESNRKRRGRVRGVVWRDEVERKGLWIGRETKKDGVGGGSCRGTVEGNDSW